MSEGQPGSGGHWIRLGIFTLNLIIASVYKLPILLTSDALNTIIIIMGSTIAVMMVSKGSSNTCKGYNFNKRGMIDIMTISEWIKYRIKYDTVLRLTPKQHRAHHLQPCNRTCRCKKYINPKQIGCTDHIGKNSLKSIRSLKVICTAFPAPSSAKPPYVCNIPQKFLVDSDSFVIGIDNHASATISNKSINFISAITTVKGIMVKFFGEVV